MKCRSRVIQLALNSDIDMYYKITTNLLRCGKVFQFSH